MLISRIKTTFAVKFLCLAVMVCLPAAAAAVMEAPALAAGTASEPSPAVMEKLRAHIEADRLAISPAGSGAFEAINPRMNYGVRFTEDGAVFSKTGTPSPWRFGMSLSGIGRAGDLIAPGPGARATWWLTSRSAAP